MASVKSTLALYGNSTILPQGLNFARTSSASRVNELGLVETIAAGEIRLDYNPSTPGDLRGWLLEESSTNNCLQSEVFGTTWTVAGDGALGTDTDKAPNATTTADNLKANSGGTVRVAFAQGGLTFTNGNKYTVSVWAKKKELDYLEISDKLDATSVTYAKTFKISDGTLGASGGTVVDSTITAYPNDWYRCTVTFTASAGMTTVFLKARSDNDVSTTSSVTASHGICLWGAQIEEKEYATSYIPTTTATVTRAADVAYVEEANSRWNWDIGTSLLIHATPLYTGGTNKPIYHYQDANNQNFVTLLNTGNVKIFSGNANQLGADPFVTGFSMTAKTPFKNMLALKKNSAHMAQNGTLSTNLAGDTNITVPLNSSSHTYTIKFFHGTGLTPSSGWLKSFAVWSNVVSDDTLESDSLMGTGTGNTNVDLYNAVKDLSITTPKLAADAVTGDKIADNSIGTEHLKLDIIVAEDIAANAITVSEIQNNAVTTDKIIDNAVTGAKIALTNDAAGDIMYYDGTNYVRLAKGTNGHLLTLAGGLPSWAADPTNVGGTAVGGDLSGTVTNAQIAANAVGSAEIANGAVGNTELGADAVDDTKIADGAIKAEHLAAGSVVMTAIGDGTLTGVKLVNDTVTGDKISDHASNDANRAIGTNHIKDLNVTPAKLANGAVTTIKILDANVTTAKILDANVTDAKIAAVAASKITGTVTNAQIASLAASKLTGTITPSADTVTSAQIADDAVDSEHYADGSIDTAHIGDLQVTDGKIANTTITGAKIANNTITSTQIAPLAVDTAQLANNAVSGSKIELGSDAQGDIMYYDGTNYVRLAAGTSGQVLTTGGSGANPAWAADSTNVGNTALGGGVLTGTVGNASIATGAITSAMLGVNVILAEDIDANAVTVAELAANAVETIKIKDLNVTTAKLADGAVTGPKIAMTSDARGDMMYHNGTSYVRLPKGSNGQVLKMGANDPAWGADIDTTIGDAAVGGNVSGTISNITIKAGVVTPTMLSASGTASNTTFLRGDGQWATPAMTETDPTAVTMAIALG